MSKIQKAIHYLLHKPSEIIAYIFMKIAFFLPDRIYLSILFRLKMGQRLNLDNPKTFNQKLQWLKLYDRYPEHTNMVDKYEAKGIAAKIIGEDHIIPTYGVWSRFEDIDFDKLPEQFVLKATNGGGNRDVIICKDKSTFDYRKAESIFKKTLSDNTIYRNFREWPYKDIKPRIIAEKYMSDESGELKDYKFYCFNGEPKMILIANERMSDNGPYFDFFDEEFQHLPFTQGAPNYYKTVDKPDTFEEMLSLAKILAHGLTHVRVDLYSVNNVVYFGEWTFFDSSGYEKFTPDEWDGIVGSWMKLPEYKKEI